MAFVLGDLAADVDGYTGGVTCVAAGISPGDERSTTTMVLIGQARDISKPPGEPLVRIRMALTAEDVQDLINGLTALLPHVLAKN